MAEVEILVKSPNEKAKAFNKRLIDTCSELLPTGADLAIVKGEPVVVLRTDLIPAEETDVDSGEAEKVGDPILEGSPIVCCICLIDPADPDRTQVYLQKVLDLADAGVEAVTIEHGSRRGWVEDPKGNVQWVEEEIAYALVVWEIDDGIAGESDLEGDFKESDTSPDKKDSKPSSSNKPKDKKPKKKKDSGEDGSLDESQAVASEGSDDEGDDPI